MTQPEGVDQAPGMAAAASRDADAGKISTLARESMIRHPPQAVQSHETGETVLPARPATVSFR